MTSCGAARAEVLTLPGFLRRKNSGGAEHTRTQDGFCKQAGSFPGAKPVKTEFFHWVIFSSLPLSPMLKQVCCCFHNLGEETDPLSAKTSGAKPNRSTDTPSWLPVLSRRGTMESLEWRFTSCSHVVCASPATLALASSNTGLGGERAVVSCPGHV